MKLAATSPAPLAPPLTGCTAGNAARLAGKLGVRSPASLAASNARECAQCAHALEVMERERQQRALEAVAMDRVRREEALERQRATKARYDAPKKHRMEEETAPPETPRATVEIIDDETLRRALNKKKYLPTGGPGGKIGRGKYKWVRVESVDEVVN